MKHSLRSYKMVVTQILNAKHAFALLGVHRESTEKEINAARRDLAGYVHPDINSAPNAGDLMAMVNAAHATLTADMDKYVRELRKKPCTACKGRGVTVKQKGFHEQVKTLCPVCEGAGVA